MGTHPIFESDFDCLTDCLSACRKMPNYSVQDQIADLQKKLTLHEGDLKAYDEASKHEIAQNNAQIAQLRAGNKALHRRLVEAKNGDAKVIENALGDRKAER